MTFSQVRSVSELFVVHVCGLLVFDDIKNEETAHMDYKKLRDTRNSSNPFAQRLGIFVEEIGPGYARAVKDITAEDANPVGVAHGGCYFSLADTACGSAMASHGYYAVTVNASYNFLRSAKLGDHLVAEARETKPGRTLCFYEVEIRDQAGTLLGNGSFTFYKLDREIPL